MMDGKKICRNPPTLTNYGTVREGAQHGKGTTTATATTL